MIFGTASTGAYSFVRGISMYAGGYPSEVAVFTMLAEGADAKELPTAFYLYFFSMIILFVFGAIYQSKVRDIENKSDAFKQA
jgi:hypothetical protein